MFSLLHYVVFGLSVPITLADNKISLPNHATSCPKGDEKLQFEQRGRKTPNAQASSSFFPMSIEP